MLFQRPLHHICTSTCTEYTVLYIQIFEWSCLYWLSILRRQHYKTLLTLISASLNKCVGVTTMERLDQGHLYFLVERRKNKRIDPSCSPNETESALQSKSYLDSILLPIGNLYMAPPSSVLQQWLIMAYCGKHMDFTRICSPNSITHCSWLCRPIASGSPLMERLDQGHLHPLVECRRNK